MAFQFPIPKPPRTPTPPTPTKDESQGNGHHEHRRGQSMTGLGIYGGPRSIGPSITWDPSSLSPLSDTFPQHRFGSMSTPMLGGPGTSPTLRGDTSTDSPGIDAVHLKNPFNFQTQTYTTAPVAKSVRRTQLQSYKVMFRV